MSTGQSYVQPGLSPVPHRFFTDNSEAHCCELTDGNIVGGKRRSHGLFQAGRGAVLVEVGNHSAAAETERDRSEPIAIVGAACRFPGAPNLDSYRRLLRDGIDAVSVIPAERWDVERHYSPDLDQPGKMYTRHGSFIEGHDKFDAQFFEIAPREAAGMDPQQRIALETAWQALENAGYAAQAPSRPRGAKRRAGAGPP